jgi:hypothetical protein
VHLVCLMVMVAAPGACLTAAVCARGIRLPAPTAIALCLAGGYLLAGGVALLLALAGVLSTATVVAGIIAVSAVPLALAWRARAPAAWPSAVRAALQEDRWPLGLGAAALVLIGAGSARFDPAVNLASHGRWRYWADAREIAVLGHVPSVTTQWGTERAATVSKLFLNCFSAAYSLLVGGQVIPAFGALYVLGAVATAAALWAVAWELGLRFTAPLLPLLCAAPLYVGTQFVYHLGLYRAEMIGRPAAFTAVALAVRALTQRGRTLPLLAGFLLGASAISHGVAALAAVLLGLSLAAAWAIARRQPRTALRTAALVAGPAVLFPALALLAAGGTLGLSGATSHYTAVHGHDPTALFSGSRRPLHTSTFYVSPTELARAFVAAATGPELPLHLLVPVIVLAIVLAVLGTWLLPGEFGWIVAGAAGFGFLLYVVALVFSARSHAYIPATFGERRMFDYAGPALTLAALPWLECAIRWAGQISRATWVVGAVAAAALAAVVAWDIRPRSVGPGAAQLREAMLAVHDNVPCTARVLANRRSNGAFEVLAGRESVLDGMAPYLRPTLLRQVLDLSAEARAALRAAPGSRAFLAREHVGYIVLLAGPGGPIASAAAPSALDRAGWLRKVYAGRQAVIYRVAGAAGQGATAPGLDCNATPG